MFWLKRLPLFPIKTKVVHQNAASILEVLDLSVYYQGRPALEKISFSLDQGERLAVVGPNGSGKSTLLKAIAGVTQPTSGKITIGGHEPSGHICIAYVPQRTQVDWQFPVRVIDVVMMGRIGDLGLFRQPSQKDHDYVHQSLEVVDLLDLRHRQISELSGGQQQRMFIARALVQRAEIVLMDEPLTGLDLTSEIDLFGILDELQKRKVAVVVTTHELDIAADRFDRVMLINRRLCGIGRPEEIFVPEKLAEAYGSTIRFYEPKKGAN